MHLIMTASLAMNCMEQVATVEEKVPFGPKAESLVTMSCSRRIEPSTVILNQIT